MDLRDYVHVARKYWRSSVAILLAAVIGAAVFSLVSERRYTATSAILLSVGGVANTASELSVGSAYAQNQAQSLALLATAPIVLKPVIGSLGLNSTPEELAENVTVTVPVGTALLDVAVTGGDATQTADIANALDDQLVAAVKRLTPSSADGGNLLVATVIRPPVAPTSPTSPRTGQNIVLGVLIGILLAAGQSLLRTILPAAARRSSPIATSLLAAIRSIRLGRKDTAGTPAEVTSPGSSRTET